MKDSRISALVIVMTFVAAVAFPTSVYAQRREAREGAVPAIPGGARIDEGSIRTTKETTRQNREGGRVVSTDYITVEYNVVTEVRRIGETIGAKPDFECKNECQAPGNHDHTECGAACSREQPARDHTKRFTGTYTPDRAAMRAAERRANRFAAQLGVHPNDVNWTSRVSQRLIELKQWAEEPVDQTMAHAEKCSWKNGTQIFGEYEVIVHGTFIQHIRRVSRGVSTNLPPVTASFHSEHVARITKPENLKTESAVNCACRKVPAEEKKEQNVIGDLGRFIDELIDSIRGQMIPDVQLQPSDALYQEMILEGVDFSGGRDIVVRQSAPSLRELFGSALESLISTPVFAAQNGGFLSIVATGLSSGDAFQIRTTDGAGTAPVRVPDGLVVQAIKSKLPATGGGKLVGSALGYCLEFAKATPSAGLLYKVANLEQQKKFAPMRSVLQAARKLADNGQLHPDSDPKGYLSAIKQWALWTKAEGWNQRAFTEKLVEHTRKNVLNSKMPWTKDLEKTVRAAAAGRWQDVGQVLGEAAKLSGNNDLGHKH